MSSLTIGAMLALVFVLSAGAIILVVIPACILSGRISDMERRELEDIDEK